MDNFIPMGFGQYSSGQTSGSFKLADKPAAGKSLTEAAPPDGSNVQPRGALLQAEGANMRYTTDGTAATASVGFLLLVGADPFFYTGDLSRLRFIQASSGGILNVGYFE